MNYYLRILSLILVVSALLPATILQVDLTIPTQTGSAGGTLVFTGTITNTSPTDTIYINGTGDNVASLFTIDFSPFLIGGPSFLAPGDSTATIKLFNILIDPSAASGPYIGNTVIFYGGADGGQYQLFDQLGSASFDITIPDRPVSGVPEPGAVVLVLGGAALLITLKMRRKHSQDRLA